MLADKGFDYDTVFHKMTMDEVDEATAALSLYNDMVKKSMRKKR